MRWQREIKDPRGLREKGRSEGDATREIRRMKDEAEKGEREKVAGNRFE